jgi:hypothetical protein
MKKVFYFAILFLITITVLSLYFFEPNGAKKIDPYSFKVPEEIQKHFSYPVKWDAVKQERWLNGELWVDSTRSGNFKCIVIHHENIELKKRI